MKTLKGFLLGLLVALVVAGAARAAPPVLHYMTASARGPGSSSHAGTPTEDPSVEAEPQETESPDPADSESPEPTESDSTEPTHKPTPTDLPTGPSPCAAHAASAGTVSPAPGLATGLANALTHVCLNLSLHPNSGLANAAQHIADNMAKHQGSAHGARTAGHTETGSNADGRGRANGHSRSRGGHGQGSRHGHPKH